jgi:hypothetical protein
MASFRVPDNYLDMVSKGDIIPKSEIESLFDCKPFDNCDIMNLIEQLGKLAVRSGRSLVFRSVWEKGSRGGVLSGIRCLTDTEASEFTQSLSDGTMRRIKKALRVSQSVDVNHLTEQQKRQHMITENMVGRRLQAMREITRRTVSEPVIHQNSGINPLRRS